MPATLVRYSGDNTFDACCLLFFSWKHKLSETDPVSVSRYNTTNCTCLRSCHFWCLRTGIAPRLYIREYFKKVLHDNFTWNVPFHVLDNTVIDHVRLKEMKFLVGIYIYVCVCVCVISVFTSRARSFSFLQNFQITSEAHEASYTLGNFGLVR